MSERSERIIGFSAMEPHDACSQSGPRTAACGPDRSERSEAAA
jgi:hypothetical protein